MPSNPVVLSVTGVSSAATTYAAGYPMWMPDYGVRPFNIGISCVTTGSPTYNIEHTLDYQGNLSSDFRGFISSAATWLVNTGISSATTATNGNYAFPVTAIRLNVSSGAGGQTVVATLVQA